MIFSATRPMFLAMVNIRASVLLSSISRFIFDASFVLCSHAHLLNHVPREHSVINISQGRTFLFVPYHHIIIQPILSHKVNSTMIAVLLQCINFDPNKIPLGIFCFCFFSSIPISFTQSNISNN